MKKKRFQNACVLHAPAALRHSSLPLSHVLAMRANLYDKTRYSGCGSQGPPLTTSAPLGDRTVHDPTTLRDVCVLPRKIGTFRCACFTRSGGTLCAKLCNTCATLMRILHAPVALLCKSLQHLCVFYALRWHSCVNLSIS